MLIFSQRKKAKERGVNGKARFCVILHSASLDDVTIVLSPTAKEFVEGVKVGVFPLVPVVVTACEFRFAAAAAAILPKEASCLIMLR